MAKKIQKGKAVPKATKQKPITKAKAKKKPRPPGLNPRLGAHPPAKPGKPGIQYPYSIRKSKYGVGIFFEQKIPKGALVWKYKAGSNSKSLNGQKEVLAYLKTFDSDNDRRLILEFAYFWEGTLNILLDDSVYCNHSDDPNTGPNETDFESCYALRDIKKGEEWFEDYGTYQYPAWYLKLMKKYKCDLSFFTIK